jgi:hypothetical protein
MFCGTRSSCALLSWTLLAFVAGCTGDADHGAMSTPLVSTGIAGMSAAGGTASAMSGAGVSGSSATAGQPAISMSMAGATSAAAGSGGGQMGMAGMAHDHAAGGMTGSAGAAGMAGTTAAEMHCLLHSAVDARDDQLTNAPLMKTVGLSQDLLVPQIVLDWMDEHEFSQAHDGWHLVRKWDQSCRKSNATAASCSAAQTLVNQGLWRADVQQGAPGDGYAFMVMHRHMIRMLKMSFPKHEALFSGFEHVPRSTSDAQNPTSWKAISWSADNIKGFDILENIEQHLDQFPTEDDLGQYIENTYKWTAQQPTAPVNAPGSGLHGALHSQWAVNGSPANLILQAVDVRNYTFWKLHGWIDNVWERYRKAKGMKEDDVSYQQALMDQCMEMYTLQPSHRKTAQMPQAGAGGGTAPAPETGYFAQNVRPFLDSTCAGCHSAIGPSAGMTLGGAGVSSVDVMKGIVSNKSTNGQYNLIEPNHPELSWVYLKASGDVASVSCTGACNRESMPPSGASLSAAQLGMLKQWIQNGATDK